MGEIRDAASGPVEPLRRRYLRLRSVLYDPVTGLPAFALLLDEVRGWLEHRRSVGVLHLEAENLGIVESLYGWQVFDRVLARIAAALRAAEGHELPAGARLGVNGVAGDRFVVFVPGEPGGAEAEPPYLRRLGAELCARVAREFEGPEFAGMNPRLAFRAGHASLALDPFHRFERRVYAALEEARAQQERRERRRLDAVGADLRRILRDSDLRTLFHPIVALGTREILGYEALSRGPEGGPLEAPAAMFAASARLGVATDLDRACREAALEACSGLDARHTVFLNGLARSFAGGADGADPAQALRRLAAAPHPVVLEFSERDSTGDPEGFVSTLAALRAEGLGIAIEDIGTGFAGQEILEAVRPDYLKLDGSLVRGIGENLIKQELLRSLVRIAKRIEASVIAEGVETEEEARALAEAGAEFGQGYLFARPSARLDGFGGSVP